MAIHACELNPDCRDVLTRKYPDVSIVAEDFLTLANLEPDCIIMNPPFNSGRDIAHVRHAYELLAEDGRLVAITSPGWTFRRDAKHNEFRGFINRIGAHVAHLPAGTFGTSGTDVATVMITIVK